MAIDSIVLRQELKANNYTLLNLPIFSIEVTPPTIALLLRFGLAPHTLYRVVMKKIYPREYGEMLWTEQNRKTDKHEETLKKLIGLISHITLKPQITEEIFLSLALQGEAATISQSLLVDFALGKLEQINSDDLVEYAATSLEFDALSFHRPVAKRLGLENTIAGYDLDLAAGLYIQHSQHELLKMQFELQASLVGRQLISGR